MNVTVLGASGRTGRLVVDEALAAGHRVTAFVRDPAKLNITHDRLKCVKGDSAHLAQVREAVKGADVVISALGPVKGSPKDLLVTAQRNIIEAMKQEGVRRYVALTGAGVRDAQDQPKLVDHIFGFLLKLTAGDVLKDSADGVDVVRSSDRDWIIVRAPRLVDGPKTGKFRVGYVGAESGTQISRADLAAFMVQQAAGGGLWVHKMPMVSY
jgi:putative NADH-flavin reductase